MICNILALYINFKQQKSYSSIRRKSGNDCDRTDVCIDTPTKWPNEKRINFDFHEETEAALNDQINVELMAFYYYLSMVDIIPFSTFKFKYKS